MEISQNDSGVPSEFDPVAILKERQRKAEAAKAEEERQKEVMKRTKAEESARNQLKVPEMIDAFFQELKTTDTVLREVDIPGLQASVRLVTVVDETTTASTKSTLLQRLGIKPTPKATREIACWTVSYGHVNGRHAILYIGIEDGVSYVNDYRRDYASPLVRDDIKHCSYEELAELIESLQSSRQLALSRHEMAQWAKEHTSKPI